MIVDVRVPEGMGVGVSWSPKCETYEHVAATFADGMRWGGMGLPLSVEHSSHTLSLILR